MRGVLDGFGLVALLIGLGFALARLGVVGEDRQELLSRLVFYVAAPALLVSLLFRLDLSNLVGHTSAITVLSVVAGSRHHPGRFGLASTRPGGADASKLALVTTLKVVVQPLIAWLLGTFAFGLGHATLLAMTVVLAPA